MRHVLIVALLALAGCAQPAPPGPITVARGASLDLSASGTTAASPQVVVVQAPAQPAPMPPLILSTPQIQTAPVAVPRMGPLLVCNSFGGMTFCN